MTRGGSPGDAGLRRMAPVRIRSRIARERVTSPGGHDGGPDANTTDDIAHGPAGGHRLSNPVRCLFGAFWLRFENSLAMSPDGAVMVVAVFTAVFSPWREATGAALNATMRRGSRAEAVPLLGV